MKRNRPARKGQSLIEYVALTALVAVVSIGAVRLFGSKVQRRLNQITGSFDHNIQVGLKVHNRIGNDDGEDDGGTGLPQPRGRARGLPGGIF
ncbi:MAG: Flp family type IVb pilin [Deltaproteobacteria bacterium]|nr:Flp family type IVb pilin [Deltaproteobacteria bacterium]